MASWSYEPKFWLNWRRIYYPSPDWLSAFCDRSTNVLSVAVHLRCVHYTSVTHTAKSVSSPFFARYLSVTYALLMRFMRSSHVPERPSSPPRRLSSPDEHRISIFLHFFCPFGVCYLYPLICYNSTIRFFATVHSLMNYTNLIDRNNFKRYCIDLSKDFFTCINSVDPEEMTHYPGLYRYSTRKAVSSIQPHMKWERSRSVGAFLGIITHFCQLTACIPINATGKYHF